MNAGFLREVAAAGLPSGAGEASVLTSIELAALPKAAQRCFQAMGAVGRPRVWSFRAAFTGRFKLGRTSGWLPCVAAQYNTRLDLARLFWIRLRYMGIVPTVARDVYLHGEGSLAVKVLDLLPVAGGRGPQYDSGELVTYLDDALLFAPTMLLGSQTEWTAVDDTTFDVTLTDRNTRVTARVYLNDDDLPETIRTNDRYFYDATDPSSKAARTPWATTVTAWGTVDGRRSMASGQAAWTLPAGPLAYADLQVEAGSLVYNVEPGA